MGVSTWGRILQHAAETTKYGIGPLDVRRMLAVAM